MRLSVFWHWGFFFFSDCVALLQGHSALVCQLQLSPNTNTVISGSADGRIIIFGIPPHSSFKRRNPAASSPSSTPRPATLTLSALNIPQTASPPSSPSPRHSSLFLNPSLRRSDRESLNDSFRIVSSITAHTSSTTGLQFDEDISEPVYNGREWVKYRRHGKRKWLISASTDGRVLLWSIGDNSEDNSISTEYSQKSIGKLVQVRALTEPSDMVWKTAIRGDILVICCARGERTVLEIWSFKDEELL